MTNNNQSYYDPKGGNSMLHVIYAANAEGYSVQVVNGSEIIHEYNAGNHAKASDTTVATNSPNALSEEELLGMASQTAHEIAKERGINFQNVNYDLDLEDRMNEEREED